MSDRLTVKERVNNHCDSFQVGDRVEAFLEPSEVEGTIIAISGHKAKIKTAWGVFTCSLVTAKRLPDPVDETASADDCLISEDPPLHGIEFCNRRFSNA